MRRLLQHRLGNWARARSRRVRSARSGDGRARRHRSIRRPWSDGRDSFEDPIEYNSATWHTNLDTYERIIEDDAKKSAITIAAAVYALAMRDDLLPRFTKETMPPLPPKPGTTPPPATQPQPKAETKSN